MSEWQPIETMPEEKADDVDARFLQAAQAVPVVGEPDCYDAGLLSDFGGGNVAWWQDYIRAELARAHDFYVGQSAPEVVPIVSKTVGYLAGGTLMRRKIQGYNCKPLIVQPTTSIPATELATLREKAAEADELRKALLALKEDCQTSNDCQYGTLSTSHVARIVDAAIAQGKGE